LPPTTPANWFARARAFRIVDDPRAVRAGEVVAKLHSELIRYWKDKRRGRDRDGEARYEQACNRARSLGLNYVPAADAAVNLTLDNILHRFEILSRRGTGDSASEVSAVLGGAPAPVVMIDGMVDEFEEIIRASLTSKSHAKGRSGASPRRRRSALSLIS
jgi:hypothetical protein